MASFGSADESVKVLISTKADTKAIKDTDDALGKLNGQADKGGDSFLKLSGAVAAGQAAFALASKAIRGAVDFFGDSVNAASEAQAAQKQLEHAVVNVSHASKEQLKQTEDLADALEKKGVLDGDNIKLGLAQLSTFGLSNKAVQKLGGSLSDLAVNQYGVSASGEQLSDTANMIAKALNGQFGILEKSGIRFTEAQKHVIEFGTEMEKVDAINAGFAQNLKFTNDVALTTTAGKMAKLRVSYENVQEAIGASITKALEPWAAKLSDFVQSDKFQKWVENLTAWFDRNLPKAIDYATNTLFPALKKIFDDTWPVIKLLIEWAGKLFTFLADNTWIIWGIVDAFVAIKTSMMLTGALAAFEGVMAGATGAFGGLSALVAAPMVMPALVIFAALASIALVYKAVVSVQDALKAMDGAAKASESLIKSNTDAANKMWDAANKGKQSLDGLYKSQEALNGQKLVYKSTNNGQASYLAGFASGGYTGSGGENQVAGVVHKGEYVVPKDQVDQSTGQPKSMGTTININNVQLTTPEAVKALFQLQDFSSLLVAKGGTPVRM